MGHTQRRQIRQPGSKGHRLGLFAIPIGTGKLWRHTAARQERLRTGLRGSHAAEQSGDSLSSKQDGLGGVAGWFQAAHPEPGQPGAGQDLEQQLPAVP